MAAGRGGAAHAAGVDGYRDLPTTQIYADYAPSPHEAVMVDRAFDRGFVSRSV
jgi:hypothetical protein